MPIFHDIKLDPETGRHKLLFVNQQYDYLMIIAYDPETQVYRAHTDGSTPESLFGADFDMDHWLKEAERLCKEADEKLIAGSGANKEQEQKEKEEWTKLIAQLHNTSDMKQAMAAAKMIGTKAKAAHVADLYELLKSQEVFVRESIAMPLSRLEKAKAFDALLAAMELGEAQGHDNDTIHNAIIWILKVNPVESAKRLMKLLQQSSPAQRSTALWGLGFVPAYADPGMIFEAYLTDTDAEVRSTAGDTLQIYVNSRKPVGDPQPFQGRWMWQDCPENMQYAFDINGDTGICIKHNAPTYAVGDPMLRIAMCHKNAFVGEQIFTNGAWYPVTGRVEDDKLYLQGAGHHWVMERV